MSSLSVASIDDDMRFVKRSTQCGGEKSQDLSLERLLSLERSETVLCSSSQQLCTSSNFGLIREQIFASVSQRLAITTWVGLPSKTSPLEWKG
mmetsp:Transcript_12114/g.33558  ORF Transcript_12114/g.33558 Transcript_12114/m.33558 type:complete len:93 (+) Transcript_12114:3124-3402(+)